MSSNPQPVEHAEAPLPDSLPLNGERVAFTGTLSSMTHGEAFGWVERFGGTATHSVSRQTTLLVVGEEGWALESDGRPSQKLCQVLQWQQVGGSCRIIGEADWLHLIGLDDRQRDVHAEYTPAMLSRLLKVPVHRIRRWESIGLLQAVRTVGRMPLFDYREVTGARRIVELLNSGVSEAELQRGLQTLRRVLSSRSASISQLPVESRDAKLLYRDQHGWKEATTGQRRLDFETADTRPDEPDDDTAADAPDAPPEQPVISMADAGPPEHRDRTDQTDQSAWTADDWFREGYRLLEDNRLAEAIEAFRLVLMDLPGNPEANFYLAESLYRTGNRMGALERYYAAVEADHSYVEAWIQLGCIHAELDDVAAAGEAMQIALQIHPENPDAHWHQADLLWRMDRKTESATHWEAYLRYDADGPWAQTARQRLEEIERLSSSS